VQPHLPRPRRDADHARAGGLYRGPGRGRHGLANRPVSHPLRAAGLVRGEADVVRDRICAAGVAEGMAIRVPSWYFRREDGQSLFAKPDDRWEFNDVADRCPEIAASLCAAADEFKSHLQSGDPAELSPLDDALIAGLT